MTSIDVTVQFESRAYTVSAFADDHITRTLQTGRFYELDLLRAIQGLNVQGIYIDVGAFIGNHTMFFARECRALEVIAIEPELAAFELLTRNADRCDGKVTAYRAAVHHTWKTAHTNIIAEANRGMTTTREGGSIPVITIDELGIPAALIKIDVEGHELPVLRSAANTIVEYRPVLVTEAHTDDRLEAIAEYLRPLNYRVRGPYARTPTYLWLPESA